MMFRFLQNAWMFLSGIFRSRCFWIGIFGVGRSCNECSESAWFARKLQEEKVGLVLTLPKTNTSTKKKLFQYRKYTSSNHWFSGDMLVLDGVWWNFRLLQEIFMSRPLLQGVTAPTVNCWGNIELKIFLWEISAICRCSFKEKTPLRKNSPENPSESSGLLHQNRWLLGMMKKQLTLQKKTWPDLNPLRQNSNYNSYMSQGLNSLHWKWSSNP